MLKKIISGGQTGADRAGLDAARTLGLQTGGYAPANFRTEGGSDPSLADYGLQTTASGNYAVRTKMNVQLASATVIFNFAERSPGSYLTAKLAAQLERPVYIFRYPAALFPSLLVYFLERHSVSTLNVAGNRESSFPGIYKLVYDFLLEALAPFRKEDNLKQTKSTQAKLAWD